jgi:pre-mRNA-processing factor 17
MNSSQFLSSGFDRLIRLWDIETGQATASFSNRKMAYSVKFYPRDNNIFICACSDNKLYQWDARSGTIVQEYNHHLQACNTVTFFDDGNKFISTSDDKKILVWEFDIPVPIKYIAEQDMHSIPSVTIHPSQTAFVGQSMDNKLVVYTCGEKVKLLRKKVFSGHTNSGYACQAGFSPNGKFVMTGDGLGQLHFWDWKTTISYRKFQAHDGGPCMSAIWHPLQPSWVATCGWDGLIKLWD